MKLQKYLECAAVVGTHGVKGNVRLENRCDSPEVLAKLKRMFRKDGDTYRELSVEHSAVQKSMVLTKFEGVETVEAAAAMRGLVLYADRDDIKLRGNAHFIVDLIGLPVIDLESGEKIGVLKDVISPGAQQIYIIDRTGDGEFMLPAVDEFVKKISLGEDDTPEGIYVKLIEGFIE